MKTYGKCDYCAEPATVKAKTYRGWLQKWAAPYQRACAEHVEALTAQLRAELITGGSQ